MSPRITPELLASAGTEQSLQSAFFCWLAPYANSMLPEHEVFKLVHAVPSGGQRAQIVGTMMKAAGVRKGVWDVAMVFPSGSHPYGYIEFKRPIHRNHKNGGLTDEQVEFGKLQLKRNAFLRIAYGWQEGRDYLLEYVNLGGGRV